MGNRLFSHLLSLTGFSEPCDTGNQRQGLCSWGSPKGVMSRHTEKRKGIGLQRKPQTLSSQGEHPPPEAARRWGERGVPEAGLVGEGGWGQASQQEPHKLRLGSQEHSMFLLCLLTGGQLNNVWLQPRTHERDISQTKLGWGHLWREDLNGSWSRSFSFILWPHGAW